MEENILVAIISALLGSGGTWLSGLASSKKSQTDLMTAIDGRLEIALKQQQMDLDRQERRINQMETTISRLFRLARQVLAQLDDYDPEKAAEIREEHQDLYL